MYSRDTLLLQIIHKAHFIKYEYRYDNKIEYMVIWLKDNYFECEITG